MNIELDEVKTVEFSEIENTGVLDEPYLHLAIIVKREDGERVTIILSGRELEVKKEVRDGG